jgi:hypothetical protein
MVELILIQVGSKLEQGPRVMQIQERCRLSLDSTLQTIQVVELSRTQEDSLVAPAMIQIQGRMLAPELVRSMRDEGLEVMQSLGRCQYLLDPAP